MNFGAIHKRESFKAVRLYLPLHTRVESTGQKLDGTIGRAPSLIARLDDYASETKFATAESV